MEGMEEPLYMDETDDFCTSILSRLSNSTQEDHQHLCTVIGAMSQELKDQNLPLSSVAYFGATCSSLDRFSGETEPPAHIIDALLTILSMILPRIPVAILKRKCEYVSELIGRIIRSKTLSSGAAASALKCISHVLIIADKINWSEVSRLYVVLLDFGTDSRPKVRRQSHLCIRDVLQSFQGTSMLTPASEGVTNILQRSLLLAGGSNASASDGPQSAQEILYILDALKESLPYMSMKFMTIILKYFKTLLEFHQPFLTRRITDSLNILCLHETVEVPPELLVDLLCSLALSAPAKETSADGMTFTARLLDVGMRKVYSLSRQICVVKLPVVFNALRDILAFEHEEALFAAMEAFKSLIHACIDENLIQQGVDQIVINANLNERKSGPTIIEKVCATIESLLDYRYNAVWDTSFQIVSALFDKLGEYSSYLLRGTLKSLSDMQKLPDEDFPYRKQLHDCVGSALGAMGPESFLSLLPLKLEAEDISEVNMWLFPILKQYTVGARLHFFKESILGMVGPIRQKSRKLELEGRIFSSRSNDAFVYSLWSLLPSFCNYPTDTAESFTELAKALYVALRDEPDVRGIICSSLQTLIQQNKRILEGINDLSDAEVSIPRQRAIAHYTSQVASDNLRILKSSARGFLSILSEIFQKSTNDTGGCLQTTISEFASISNEIEIRKFFLNTMRQLQEVTEKASTAENLRKSNYMQVECSLSEGSLSHARAQLFDLAVALLPGLNAAQTKVLFLAIVPALGDADGLIQKKAYKVLSIMLRNCDDFLSENLEELLNILIEVLPSCHFSAKRHRLDCLYFLVVRVSKDELERRWHSIISSFLTEIILALKEANKKTRNRAYDLLVQIGHAYGDEEKGGNKENLHKFFNMVAGGLAGETPHMISAAVKGLARLAYEFSDLVYTAYNVLPSTFILLQRKNKEIIKANLGLLKVLVAKSQAEGLEAHLKSVVEGLLKWQDNTKNKFKSKVKLLLEMLVKKCGLQAVKAVMPEEHMKLLTNIRKIKERRERKSAATSEEIRSLHSKATTSRLSRWNHTKIFSDFDDGEMTGSDAEYMDASMLSNQRSKAASQFNSKASSLRSKKMLKASKSLEEDFFDQVEDEPLDLLDRQKTRSALRSSEHLKRKAESDDELEIDSEGRLVIHEGGKPKREAHSDPDLDIRSRAGSYLSVNSSRKIQKRRKTSMSGWAYTGSEYGSKKAGGDVKRKGKLDPHAYWPLDRKMMSRRPEHRAAARKGMASVVRQTKKLEGKSTASALKGLKSKRNQKKATRKVG
ncbi:uncharacterized protein LOC131157934 [Malania oleifera]|uniref:uncharacterized protein LOC131157934 n=1 Tax=Malania oleifera TaxID=397392 RepID=UPI0025ADFA5E|nr:uncharacterized protein LOC131157934 [Malania oleifera]